MSSGPLRARKSGFLALAVGWAGRVGDLPAQEITAEEYRERRATILRALPDGVLLLPCRAAKIEAVMAEGR